MNKIFEDLDDLKDDLFETLGKAMRPENSREVTEKINKVIRAKGFKKKYGIELKTALAAPELLEACKHLVAILSKEDEDFYNKHIHAFNLGMDAIKKAER